MKLPVKQKRYLHGPCTLQNHIHDISQEIILTFPFKKFLETTKIYRISYLHIFIHFIPFPSPRYSHIFPHICPSFSLIFPSIFPHLHVVLGRRGFLRLLHLRLRRRRRGARARGGLALAGLGLGIKAWAGNSWDPPIGGWKLGMFQHIWGLESWNASI